jgi:hypothetical protein
MSNSVSNMEKAAVTEGGTRWGQCAVLGAVWALVIGLYAWCANSGMLELMGSGAKDSYYNLQVQAFRDGHLNLERQVPPEYGDPPNFKWDGNYGLDDLSYYKGRLYLYFGVTPALVLFWPYAAFTGHYLLHKDAAVIFFSAGFLAGAGLLWAVWRRYFKESGIGTLATGMLAVGLGNFAPAVLGRSDVYEVAVGCGYALTMLALCGIWFALHDTQRRWRWLAAASLAVAGCGHTAGSGNSGVAGKEALVAVVGGGVRADPARRSRAGDLQRAAVRQPARIRAALPTAANRPRAVQMALLVVQYPGWFSEAGAMERRFSLSG